MDASGDAAVARAAAAAAERWRLAFGSELAAVFGFGETGLLLRGPAADLAGPLAAGATFEEGVVGGRALASAYAHREVATAAAFTPRGFAAAEATAAWLFPSLEQRDAGDIALQVPARENYQLRRTQAQLSKTEKSTRQKVILARAS